MKYRHLDKDKMYSLVHVNYSQSMIANVYMYAHIIMYMYHSSLSIVVMSSLQELSMKTSILSDPGQDYQLPDYRGGPPPTS